MAVAQTKAPAAFLSYAHRDDRFGDITRLRERLAHAVGVALGEEFEIFQDRDGIAWGQHWPGRLDEALEQAVFLIPILSPSYFASGPCRAELEKFLELERRTGRRDLILPIYLRTARPFEDKSDPLAALLRERQYRDWRGLRHQTIGAPEVIQRLDQLADEIEAAIRRPAPVTEEGKPAPPPEGGSIAEGPPVHPPAAKHPPDLEPIEEERLVMRNVALRAAPSLAAGMVTRLKASAVVYVAGRTRDSGWLLVEGDDELRGYVVADAVEPLGRTHTAKATTTVRPAPRLLRLLGLARLPAAEEQPKALLGDLEEFVQMLPRSATDADKMLATGFFAQGRSGDNTFGTGDANNLLLEQGIKVGNPSQCVKQNLNARRVFAVQRGRYRVSQSGVDYLRQFMFWPGKVFRDVEAPWCPELVVIPAGRFRMGSPADDREGSKDERPQHEVTIGAPFALGRYPVTFAEYDAFCDATGQEKPGDEGWGRGRQPVIHVSWEDAQTYVAWLREQTDQPYRLPSEAEWEYACRAGTLTRYWWGDGIAPADANFGRIIGRTSEVGTYRPNPWGLHDMLGNVGEWVEDRWHESYEDAPTDGSAWVKGEDSGRVVRGGFWGSAPVGFRSAFRFRILPNYRDYGLGFRVSRALSP